MSKSMFHRHKSTLFVLLGSWVLFLLAGLLARSSVDVVGLQIDEADKMWDSLHYLSGAPFRLHDYNNNLSFSTLVQLPFVKIAEHPFIAHRVLFGSAVGLGLAAIIASVFIRSGAMTAFSIFLLFLSSRLGFTSLLVGHVTSFSFVYFGLFLFLVTLFLRAKQPSRRILASIVLLFSLLVVAGGFTYPGARPLIPAVLLFFVLPFLERKITRREMFLAQAGFLLLTHTLAAVYAAFCSDARTGFFGKFASGFEILWLYRGWGEFSPFSAWFHPNFRILMNSLFGDADSYAAPFNLLTTVHAPALPWIMAMPLILLPIAAVWEAVKKNSPTRFRLIFFTVLLYLGLTPGLASDHPDLRRAILAVAVLYWTFWETLEVLASNFNAKIRRAVFIVAAGALVFSAAQSARLLQREYISGILLRPGPSIKLYDLYHLLKGNDRYRFALLGRFDTHPSRFTSFYARPEEVIEIDSRLVQTPNDFLTLSQSRETVVGLGINPLSRDFFRYVNGPPPFSKRARVHLWHWYRLDAYIRGQLDPGTCDISVSCWGDDLVCEDVGRKLQPLQYQKAEVLPGSVFYQ
jgi:hypothetical protein